jgi:RNA polymerase sigma-70 factor (ECF subfamily)
MNNERELVERARAGETEAFGELVERNANLLVCLLRSLTGEISSAEDLAQETFVRAFRSIGTLKDPEHFRAWLCGIARHIAADHLRQRTSRPQNIPLNPEHAAHPSANDDSLQRFEQIWSRLEELPEDQRQAVALKYSQDLSYQEIAEIMNVPPSTVRGLLYRALKTLRGRLPE